MLICFIVKCMPYLPLPVSPLVKLSSNEASFRNERLYVNKLNIILVQVFPCSTVHHFVNFLYHSLLTLVKLNRIECQQCRVCLFIEASVFSLLMHLYRLIHI